MAMKRVVLLVVMEDMQRFFTSSLGQRNVVNPLNKNLKILPRTKELVHWWFHTLPFGSYFFIKLCFSLWKLIYDLVRLSIYQVSAALLIYICCNLMWNNMFPLSFWFHLLKRFVCVFCSYKRLEKTNLMFLFLYSESGVKF